MRRWKQIVLIEFNELSPVLLDRFIAEESLPGFARLRSESIVMTTDADASQPNLEPWVQWPTIHLGVSHRQHRIRHLGDTDDRFPPIGELLSLAGIPVGIFGSMNLQHHAIKGFAIPDPWNARQKSTPEWLEPFHRTVAAMVTESSRQDGSVPSGAGLTAFGRLMATHGLRPRTVGALARQLLDERRDPGLAWRRASALDLLQYDLFRHMMKKTGARFGTFFSNSTAHYQHYFWRHMDPGSFEVGPERGEHPSLKGAIPYGYAAMDRLLLRFMRDFPEALLVLCTALSQEPWTDSTKLTYRPKDFDRLLKFAGVDRTGVTIEPIMAEEFVIRFSSEQAALRAESQLEGLRVGGLPALRFVNEGTYLVGGCAITDANAPERQVTPAGNATGLAFNELFYPIHTVRSGRHNPDGVLWWRVGHHQVVNEPVELTAIAPTILSQFSVPAPEHMTSSPLFIDS